MAANWVTPPFDLLAARSAPLLVSSSDRDPIASALEGQGVRVDALPIGGSRSVIDFFLAFRSVVHLPDWCANGWDPLYDAFDELCADNQFPLALIVDGLPDLLERATHLALETVVRLEELARALATRERQLLVIYLGPSWS
jgi:hypothetical protein